MSKLLWVYKCNLRTLKNNLNGIYKYLSWKYLNYSLKLLLGKIEENLLLMSVCLFIWCIVRQKSLFLWMKYYNIKFIHRTNS